MSNQIYCPNPKCINHSHTPENNSWIRKKGFVETKRDGKVQRYQCKICLSTFSLSYFSIDHYVHRKLSYPTLLNHLVSGSGIRDMARAMHSSPNMITNRIRRLSRRITSVCPKEIHDLELSESVAADGLENFILSQYFPTNINILAGQRSQFIYTFNAYHFKRKGACTDEQKKRKSELYESAFFEKGAASRRFREILHFLSEKSEKSSLPFVFLDTDEHPIYRYQFEQYEFLSPKIRHRRTNSRIERNYQNKLFPCNYIDRQIRKDLAEYIRETVQFGRNMNNSMDRFSCYCFWHNFLKPFRINRRKRKYLTHSHAAGFTPEKNREITYEVFHGNRKREVEFVEYLTDFQKAHWTRTLLNPLNKKAV